MINLYVEIFDLPESGTVRTSLKSAVCLFILHYCKSVQVRIHLVVTDINCNFSLPIDLSALEFITLNSVDLPRAAKLCALPVMLTEDNVTCVAGFCSVVRCMLASDPDTELLGFRNGCLMACAKTSVWTRFCEIDIFNSVENFLTSVKHPNTEILFSQDVMRFEAHLSQPLRIHNIEKKRQDELKKNSNEFNNPSLVLEHCFSEGPSVTLADIILFPCIHLILRTIDLSNLNSIIPLTLKWYENVSILEGIQNALGIFLDTKGSLDINNTCFTIPEVPNESLYKSDPKRYKPRSRIFTRQEEISSTLNLINSLPELKPDVQECPFGYDFEFDWNSLPYEAHPEGGGLPKSRVSRKANQLENLVKSVLKLAKPGYSIVDFCSGSGHLGIIIAYLLPSSTVILLENKHQSLQRAKLRASQLKLSNIMFCQSNIDYFCYPFDIGVALHACGVATDLVIQRCLDQNAAFVCCPCCYGSVQNNHILSYPRSKCFRASPLTLREYLVLGHSADQTHDETNAKTQQGNECMAIIDTDRCLHAKEAGYSVFLAKLKPHTCTPKNNLLVGIPGNWVQ